MTTSGDLAALIGLARDHQDGTSCSDELRAALLQTMERRRGLDGPSPPMLGHLTVRREGLPDWWGPHNLLLAAPGVTPTLMAGLGFTARTGNVAVVGTDANVARLSLPGCESLIVVGDRVDMPSGNLTARNGGTILLGEDCTALSWARADARNGGAILVGSDGMWGVGVNLVTDDMHAIRELEGGRRTNVYGGRIVLERHVWLCEQVRLTGGAHVGADAVIGLGALVRSGLPAGSVCVGSPARPIRHGVTWTREDLP